MRNGVLIAEDSPKNIAAKLEASNLEEAFLKLSQKQELSMNDGTNDNAKNSVDEFELHQHNTQSASTSTKEISTFRNDRVPKIMKALLMKNFTELIRNFM
jgi:hypothetical protein